MYENVNIHGLRLHGQAIPRNISSLAEGMLSEAHVTAESFQLCPLREGSLLPTPLPHLSQALVVSPEHILSGT